MNRNIDLTWAASHRRPQMQHLHLHTLDRPSERAPETSLTKRPPRRSPWEPHPIGRLPRRWNDPRRPSKPRSDGALEPHPEGSLHPQAASAEKPCRKYTAHYGAASCVETPPSRAAPAKVPLCAQNPMLTCDAMESSLKYLYSRQARGLNNLKFTKP